MTNVSQGESTTLCEEGEETGPPNGWSRIVFLSEAKGVNGSPVIIFRECPDFGELHAQDLSRLLVNLTIMKSSLQVGYTLLFDSRNDKLSSVKKMLKHISRSFLSDLQLVLVIKPMSWSHSFFSDSMLNSVKKDFRGKVPIIMVKLVAELADYIDPTQLPPELQDTNEKHKKKGFKYSHVMRQYQSQKVLEMRLKKIEMNLKEEEQQNNALEAALENMLQHAQTWQMKRDEVLAETDSLKTSLAKMHEKSRAVLTHNEQLKNEMSCMVQVQTDIYLQLTQKELLLKQKVQSQNVLNYHLKDAEIRLKETEEQNESLKAALENRSLQTQSLEKECDKVLAQGDNLKTCIEKFQVNYKALMSTE